MRNAEFGQTFSIANMFDKLKGTAYYDALMTNLDIRSQLANENTSDDEIKKQLKDPNSAASQSLREYKLSLEADNRNDSNPQERDDYSPSNENITAVRRIAENAQKLKSILTTVSEKREQIKRDYGDNIDDDAADAILYQQLSVADKDRRINEINKELQQVSNFDVEKQEHNTSKKIIARYGSLEGLRAEKQQLEQQRDRLQQNIDSSSDEIKELQKKADLYKKSLDEQGKETSDSYDLRLTPIE